MCTNYKISIPIVNIIIQIFFTTEKHLPIRSFPRKFLTCKTKLFCRLATVFLVISQLGSYQSIQAYYPSTGTESLPSFLSQVDILVNLLPYTPQTHRILDFELIRQLRGNPKIGGAILINAGRGKSIVEDDIIRTLDEGILAGVSLDVFETEPLPRSSPLWNNPKVVITPHVAADSDPHEFAMYVSQQIRNYECGLGLDNVVDRNKGY